MKKYCCWCKFVKKAPFLERELYENHPPISDKEKEFAEQRILEEHPLSKESWINVLGLKRTFSFLLPKPPERSTEYI